MIIPLLFSFITLFATCTIEYGTLTMQRSLSTHIVVRFITYSLGTSIYFFLHHLGIKQPIYYYCISAIYLGACHFLFTESLAQKIFLFFSDWCFTTFVSALCNWATTWIIEENLRITMRAGLYILCFVILIPLYYTFGRQYVREMLNRFDKANHIYAAFPFLSLVLFTILFGPLNRTSSFSQFLTMALFICFIVFSYYIMIMHFHTIFSRLQVANNLLNAERELSLQKKYYAEVEKSVRIQKERLHDTRHHLVALSAMASAKKTEALKDYISDVLEQYSHYNAVRYCENDVANAVLGGYISIAEEKHITVSAELDLPQEMGIDEYELCTLFGNTLENAIEACQRIPTNSPLYDKRYIKLRSRVEGERLTIRIENTFIDDSTMQKEKFTSSKGSRGGVGLQSVNAVLDLYQGCQSCERHDGVFIFSAVLYLRENTRA